MPGGRIDAARTFSPLGIAVLTISDSRDAATDTSGDRLADRDVDGIISTGGTGLTGRDVTPEAVRELFEKELEGFAVLWHLASYETVGGSTIPSRACGGIAGGTVIYALPGSNGACRDGWDRLICPQLDSRHRPCSIVEVIPRFQET